MSDVYSMKPKDGGVRLKDFNEQQKKIREGLSKNALWFLNEAEFDDDFESYAEEVVTEETANSQSEARNELQQEDNAVKEEKSKLEVIADIFEKMNINRTSPNYTIKEEDVPYEETPRIGEIDGLTDIFIGGYNG